MRRYETPVFKLIRRMVRRDDVAEELTQDTFVNMLEGLHTYRRESRFSSWLFSIATHLALNHLKATRREDAALERAPQAITPGRIVGMGNAMVTRDSTTDKVRQREIARALDRAIDRLPEDQRVCYVLHFRENRSYEDIARTLGLPKGTVGTRIHRARKRLRRAHVAYWGSSGRGIRGAWTAYSGPRSLASSGSQLTFPPRISLSAACLPGMN